jgi:hypothetical protein
MTCRNLSVNPHGKPTIHRRSTTDGQPKPTLLVLPRIPGRTPAHESQPRRRTNRNGSPTSPPLSSRLPLGPTARRTDRLLTVHQRQIRTTDHRTPTTARRPLRSTRQAQHPAHPKSRQHSNSYGDAMLKPCLDCGTPADSTRCHRCGDTFNRARNRQATLRRQTNGGRIYQTGAYRTASAYVRANATRCHLCGNGPRDNDPWQADHLIPVAGGGELGPLLPAHRSCNIARSNRLRAGKPDTANLSNYRGHPHTRTTNVREQTRPETDPAHTHTNTGPDAA